MTWLHREGLWMNFHPIQSPSKVVKTSYEEHWRLFLFDAESYGWRMSSVRPSTEMTTFFTVANCLRVSSI